MYNQNIVNDLIKVTPILNKNAPCLINAPPTMLRLY